MKRDLDLTRSILLIVEDAEEEILFRDLKEKIDDSYSDAEIIYNTTLIQKAGLLDVDNIAAWGGDRVYINYKAITWDGYEYLDSVRDNRVWKRTKKLLNDTVGQTTFDLVKFCAYEVAKKMLTEALSK